MRFRKKTSYRDDLRLFKFRADAGWYAALLAVLLALPAFADSYTQQQLVFVFIYAIAGVGLMLLSGFTGLLSLGHATFLGIGAYSAAILYPNGVDFALVLVIAAVLSGIAGIAIGLPALRLYGIYLAIATLAIASIAETMMSRWEGLTNGNKGLFVGAPTFLFVKLGSVAAFYYLALALCVLAILGALNLLRTPTGRAMIAIRDSETAARALGVNVAGIKTLAFAISAAYTGVAGALLAHSYNFVEPDQFTVGASIELLILVFIGGTGSIRGAVLGAIFVVMLPQLIAGLKDDLPGDLGAMSGLQPAVFGLVLLLFILFEPGGINALWLKLKFYLDRFPLYRRDTFRRQRSFARGERW